MEDIDNDETVEVIEDIFKSQAKLVEDLCDIHIKHCQRMIDIYDRRLGIRKRKKNEVNT